MQDVLAVGALGCSGETQQHLWSKMFKNSRVGLGLGAGVVELINDDHVEPVGGEVIEVQVCQGLHGREDVAPLRRPLAADELLAERAVAHDVGERGLALLQDLVAVGDEEKRVDLTCVVESSVVESSDHRLAGARCHHDEVAMPVVNFTLGRQLVEDLPLIPPRPHVE